MERKFIEFFTGLDRNFGYCDLSNAKVNPDTGKLEIPIKNNSRFRHTYYTG